MALSKVQSISGNSNNNNTVTLTFASAPTIGNAIVVYVCFTNDSVISVTDNRGNTYQLALQNAPFGISNNVTNAIYYCKSIIATGTPFSITVTISGNFHQLTGCIIEVGGTGGNLYVDRTTGSSGSLVTSVDTGSTYVLDTAGDAFIVAGVCNNQAQTAITVESVSPAWTQEYESLVSTPFLPSECDTRIITSANGTTQKCSWVFTGTTGQIATILVAFKTDITTGLTKVQAAKPNANIASLTFPFAPTIGNAIVFTAINNNSLSSSVVTDNWGNKYFLDSAVGNCAIFSCPSIVATGSPFTVTISNTQFVGISAIEIANAVGGLYPDRIGTGTGTGTTQSTTVTAALRANKVFVAAVMMTSNAGTFITVGSVSPPWMQEWDQLSGSSSPGEVDTRVLNGVIGTTQNISWTSANSGNWAAALIAYASASDLPVPETRVTQDVIETVTLPINSGIRVTQDAVELLSAAAIPQLRVTQVAVEIITGAVVVATVTETTRFFIILP